jgi:hypothetical protein
MTDEHLLVACEAMHNCLKHLQMTVPAAAGLGAMINQAEHHLRLARAAAAAVEGPQQDHSGDGDAEIPAAAIRPNLESGGNDAA